MHASKRAWTWTTNKLYMYYDLEFFALTIVFNGITFHFCEHMAICVFVLCLHSYFFFFVVISLIHIILSLGFECDAQAKIRFRLLSHSNIFSKRFWKIFADIKKRNKQNKKKNVYFFYLNKLSSNILQKKKIQEKLHKKASASHTKLLDGFVIVKNEKKWNEKKNTTFRSSLSMR